MEEERAVEEKGGEGGGWWKRVEEALIVQIPHLMSLPPLTSPCVV